MAIRSIIVVFVGIFVCINSQEAIGQNNPFWYPQATQSYSAPSHYIAPQRYHYQNSYEMIPSTVYDVQPSDIQWHTAPRIGVEYAFPAQPVIGEIQIPHINSNFSSSGVPQPAQTILEQSTEPSVDSKYKMAPGELDLPPENQDQSDNVEDLSPMDVDLQTLEQQAQREAAQRVLILDDKVQGLEDMVANLQRQLKTAQSGESTTGPDADETSPVEELKKANAKVKADLEKKLANQKTQIETLKTRLRELEENREAAKTGATQEDVARIHTELKKALEAIRTRTERDSNVADSQDRLKMQLDQIAEIVEREVQESIREEKERIIRSVIRRAAKELQEKKGNATENKDD